MPTPQRISRATQGPSRGRVFYLQSKKAAPKRNRANSYEQLRQRELAWMLYITEGYLANLEHALAINCVTFKPADAAAAATIIAQTEKHAEKLRVLLKDISPEG